MYEALADSKELEKINELVESYEEIEPPIDDDEMEF